MIEAFAKVGPDVDFDEQFAQLDLRNMVVNIVLKSRGACISLLSG